MIGTTPLDQALEAWYRPADCGKQLRTDDAAALLEWDVFSIKQVAAICQLPEHYVRALARKRDHTGGNLAPESLPMLLELRQVWLAGERLRARGVAQRVYAAGTKQSMTSVLTGVPMSTLYRWMRHG